VGASLLAVLVVSVLLAAVARRFDVSAPLALVVAGLAAGLIPGFKQIELDPELVLYVLLPPLLWSAGTESSYVALRRNIRPIGLLAVGLPLATTLAVGFVAYKTVPELTVMAPEKVLAEAPSNVSVPVPFLVNVPVPLMMPLSTMSPAPE